MISESICAYTWRLYEDFQSLAHKEKRLSAK